ncbi:methyltransferase domain-containing protein [Corynebacterium macginleyi]|uniref:class I SAM-dependent methyltransferase n=1 Tax=Corynebacterium macginleyi TaxID=38290 RepID=UPI00190A0F2A|nr:methyltransferase domain-containing protein [Corynebacterium macginleyi]MBK4166931.1 methyltransferase domain-containing protein [Corynebacterium macginleyi]
MYKLVPKSLTLEARKKAQQHIEAYLRNEPRPRLHLGVGPIILPGWINSDVSPLHRDIITIDATEPLPFPENSLEAVFCEHLIEHLPFTAGQTMIAEVFRVLRPGSIFRLSTPDLQRLRELLVNDRDEVPEKYVRVINSTFGEDLCGRDPAFTLNSSFCDYGHIFLYTREVLQRAFETEGFNSLSWTMPFVSEHELLTGLEDHGRLLGDERLNSFECMVLEGSKPSKG